MDEENLTPEERETVRDDGVSGEEAHRIGEFRDLRDLIEGVRDEIRVLSEDVASTRQYITGRFDGVVNSIAGLTEEGAVIREGDVDNDGDADVIAIDAIDYPSAYDVITPLDDLDLKL